VLTITVYCFFSHYEQLSLFGISTHCLPYKSFNCINSDNSVNERDSRKEKKCGLAEEEQIFPLASVSRPALGPTLPAVQWVPAVLSPGLKRGQGMTLTTHTHLVRRSRMSRSYTSSPPKAPLWCVVGQR
jgi:hypothetical protein